MSEGYQPLKVTAEVAETSVSPQHTEQLEATYGTGADKVGELAQAALDQDAQPEVVDLAQVAEDRERTLDVFEDRQPDFENFENQFKKDHHLTFEKDTLTYKMVSPSPENLITDEWVVFVGGFNTQAQNYKYEIANLVQSGRRVLFVNPETPKTPYKNRAQGASPHLSPLIQLEVRALASLLANEGITRADFVGHSRGGLVAATLASEQPGLAHRLILDCPAGFTGGKEDPWALMGRAMEDSEGEKKLQIEEGIEPSGEFLDQISENMWWKLLDEVPAIAKSNIVPSLEKLRAYKNKGESDTEVILVNANNDKVFTPQHIASALGENPFELIDRHANYANERAGHGNIARPEPGVVPQVLDQIEAKEARRVHAQLLAA